MKEGTTFSQDVKALIRERASGSHPSAEVLLDYHFRKLGGEKRERLQDHLVGCPQCSRTILDMATFPQVEPAARAEEPPAWNEQRARNLARVFAAGAEAVRQRRRPGELVARYLAAGLAATCLVLIWRLANLDSRLEDARSSLEYLQQTQPPEHSFEIVSLQPSGSFELRSGPDQLPAVHGSSGPVPVMLNTFLPDPGPFNVELVDGAGEVKRTWEGLRRTSRKNLTLALDPRSLPAGEYELLLRGSSEDLPRVLARFPLAIEP